MCRQEAEVEWKVFFPFQPCGVNVYSSFTPVGLGGRNGERLGRRNLGDNNRSVSTGRAMRKKGEGRGRRAWRFFSPQGLF